jgi:hypothetical protein
MVVVVDDPVVCVVVVVVVGAVLVTVALVLVVIDGVTIAGPKLPAAALNHETKTIPETINSSIESVAARKLRLKDSTS